MGYGETVEGREEGLEGREEGPTRQQTDTLVHMQRFL